MKRAVLAALVLLAGLGGLCTAWYTSSRRALDAELREREQGALRASTDRERAIAESLARRLEELRRDESQRPYFHYQNLYHDPKGVSEGLSVVPSPLANGSGNPLVTAYFQIENKGRVTLPTLNEEVRELNAPDVAKQRALRDALARSSASLREAAAPLVATLTSADARTREAAERIADLEERLARSQAEAARVGAPALGRATEVGAPTQSVQKGQQSQMLDPSAFRQNAAANDVYRELKNRAVNAPPTVQQENVIENAPLPRPRRERPVEIRTTDLEWHTVTVDGTPRLVALRGVLTPSGSLLQGILTPLADGAVVEGASVQRGKGTPMEGIGWRVQLDPAAPLAGIRREHARDVERFGRTFAGVTASLLLVVAAIVWMVWRAEALATEKSRFAATAAHELRTPLASLRLYSEMIADERDPVRRERYAREISGQTERLGRLVANVLEVTRIERGTFALQPRRGDIGPAVEACIEKLRPQMEAAGCPVELRVAPDLPVVAFDADALHHIVDNLLDNAEKYSRDTPRRNVSVAVGPEDGGVSITVSDRGPGLPDHVFREPRPFRRSSGGLGLGLFLVDRIVRAHGGAIRSTAAPGGGASVHVFLPCV